MTPVLTLSLISAALLAVLVWALIEHDAMKKGNAMHTVELSADLVLSIQWELDNDGECEITSVDLGGVELLPGLNADETSNLIADIEDSDAFGDARAAWNVYRRQEDREDAACERFHAMRDEGRI